MHQAMARGKFVANTAWIRL